MSSGTTLKRRLYALNRRADHLKKRIEESDKDLTYDKTEYTALVWAINLIEEYPELAIDAIKGIYH